MRAYGSFHQHQERPVKIDKSKTGRRRLFILAIFIVLVYLGYKMIPDGYFLQVKEQVLEKSMKVTALVVRDEKVLTAPFTGKLKMLAEKGERIPAGAVVVSVVNGPAEEEVISFWSGVVSYEIDGLENTFRPQNIEEIAKKGIFNWRYKETSLYEGQRVNIGQPVCKILDNLCLYLLLELKDDVVQSYIAPDERLELKLKGRDRIYTVPEEILPVQNGKRVLVFRLYNIPETFLYNRWVELELVIQKFHGTVVPREALSFYQGEAGVFVEGEEQEKIFQAVSIIGEVDEQVVVKGLEPGTRVWVKRR